MIISCTFCHDMRSRKILAIGEGVAASSYRFLALSDTVIGSVEPCPRPLWRQGIAQLLTVDGENDMSKAGLTIL